MLAKHLFASLAATMNFAAAGAVLAQSDPAIPQSSFCFHAEQISRCSSYFIFELRGEATINEAKRTFTYPFEGSVVSENLTDLPSYVSLEVGKMKNRSSSSALGGSVEVGFRQGAPFRVSAKARHRTWLDNGLAADVAAGPLGVQLQECFTCRNSPMALGGTADAVVSYKDEIGLLLGADVIHGSGRTSTAFRAGGELGSHAAVLATVASALVLGFLSALYASSGF